MSEVKADAIAIIESLSDDCTLEEIHYHLYVRAKVERGIRAIDKGQLFTNQEVEKRMRKWLESSGQSRH